MKGMKTIVGATGYPVAYDHFGDPQKMPFICYLGTDSNNFFADGGVYETAEGIRVELYTAFRDPVAENKVEAALSDFCWNKSTEYLDDERCYMTTYEFEV